MRRGNPVEKIISIAIFIALEVFCVVLISHNSSVQHYQIASTIRNVNNHFAQRHSAIESFFNLRVENEKLAEENALLRARIDELSAIVEIKPVVDSSKLMNDGRFTFTAAKVINNTVNRQHNFLILDKGTEDGIKEGMGVITSKGVIGIISVCDQHYCKVKSLLDPDIKVSGKLLKDNNLGLVSWGGQRPSRVNMTELPTHTEIAVGDTIVTSGYSALFPQGIPIGKVHSSKSDGVSVMAVLELFENFHSLQYVYIVNDSDMESIKNLEDKE